MHAKCSAMIGRRHFVASWNQMAYAVRLWLFTPRDQENCSPRAPLYRHWFFESTASENLSSWSACLCTDTALLSPLFVVQYGYNCWLFLCKRHMVHSLIDTLPDFLSLLSALQPLRKLADCLRHVLAALQLARIKVHGNPNHDSSCWIWLIAKTQNFGLMNFPIAILQVLLRTEENPSVQHSECSTVPKEKTWVDEVSIHFVVSVSTVDIGKLLLLCKRGVLMQWW